MEEKILLFFNQKPAALDLYLALERQILAEIGNVSIKIQKTQISFYNRHMFACASLAKTRKAKDLPDPYLTVTFGLERKVESPRIDIATEPYPRRWTHHVVIASPEEIDEELMGWIREASVFSEKKR